MHGILESYSQPTSPWLFAPGLSWDRQLFQRPQQLALALARQGELVFYWEPAHNPPFQGVQQLQNNLFWVDLPGGVLKTIPQPYLYHLPWTYPLSVTIHGAKLIYDIVDDFSTFKGDARVLCWLHAQRMRQARLVLVSARPLEARFKVERLDVVYCPNGVNPADFEVQPRAVPDDIQPWAATGRPIAGYVGALAEWFDYELLAGTARLCPEVEFVLIGPTDGSALLESGLLSLENVHWLGPKPYPEIPAYLSVFTIGLIPFKLNAITHAVSPLKAFEYMAAGKPVVISPMHESLSLPHVIAGEGTEAFAGGIRQALQRAGDPQFVQGLYAAAQANTWDARARLMLAKLAMV